MRVETIQVTEQKPTGVGELMATQSQAKTVVLVFTDSSEKHQKEIDQIWKACRLDALIVLPDTCDQKQSIEDFVQPEETAPEKPSTGRLGKWFAERNQYYLGEGEFYKIPADTMRELGDLLNSKLERGDLAQKVLRHAHHWLLGQTDVCQQVDIFDMYRFVYLKCEIDDPEGG